MEEFRELLAARRRRKLERPWEFYRPLKKLAGFHVSQARVKAIIAANRAGKTEAHVAQAARRALGMDPHRPNFPVPNYGWITSVSNEAQREILQPKFERYLPPSHLKNIIYRQRRVWDQLILPNGSIIGFKSCEMDRKVFQGAALHWASFDEEPDYDIYQEVLTRLTDYKGDCWLTFTPINGMCFDVETKLLTENGWCAWNQVKLGDLMGSYNRTTGKLEWKPCRGLYLKDAAGSMVRITGRGFSALVTENHRWVVRDRERLLETRELRTGQALVQLADWAEYPTERSYPDAWIRLLGWVLTDGTIPRGKRSVMIYQSTTANAAHVETIERAALSAGCRVRRKDYAYTGRPEIGTLAHIALYGEAVDFIRSVGKDLPMWLLRKLTREQLEILYDAMIDGDGTRTPTGEVFTQKTHPKVADGFQALCTMLGIGSTRQGLKTYARSKRKNERVKSVESLSIEEVPYSGLIWCASTENETLIAQRDGTVYVSGNTWTYDEFIDPATKNKDVEVFTASMWDNAKSRGGHLDDDEVQRFEDRIRDPIQRRIRVYGEYHSQVGRIYKSFDRNTHVLQELPADMLAADGTLNANLDTYVCLDTGRCFAATFFVVDYFGNVFLFDEYFDESEGREGTINYRARTVLNMCSKWGINPEFTLDASSQFFIDLSELGINANHGDNDVEKGIAAVQDYMAVNPKRTIGPRFCNPKFYVVGPRCPRFLYEVQRYSWDTPASSGPTMGEKKNKPRKKDDHVVDTVRYMIVKKPEASRPPEGEDNRPIQSRILEYVKKRATERGQGTTKESFGDGLDQF